MVIQRWQSLLLLIATILVAIFCFTPIAREASANGGQMLTHTLSEAPVLLIVNILIAALLTISIFMYKNLKQQRKLTILTIVLMSASLVSTIFLVYNSWPGASFYWFGGILLLSVALVLALGAYRCMGRDLKLLRSYNRLR